MGYMLLTVPFPPGQQLEDVSACWGAGPVGERAARYCEPVPGSPRRQHTWPRLAAGGEVTACVPDGMPVSTLLNAARVRLTPDSPGIVSPRFIQKAIRRKAGRSLIVNSIPAVGREVEHLSLHLAHLGTHTSPWLPQGPGVCGVPSLSSRRAGHQCLLPGLALSLLPPPQGFPGSPVCWHFDVRVL